jgi:hypothetical protein
MSPDVNKDYHTSQENDDLLELVLIVDDTKLKKVCYCLVTTWIKNEFFYI